MLILKSAGPVKWLGLILGVIILNIVVLSPGLFAVEIGGHSAMETAAAVTLLFVSLMIVLYASFSLLNKPSASLPLKRLETHEDYVSGLNAYRNVKALKSVVLLALEQLERIGKKKSALRAALSQRFDAGEMSFRKFEAVIAGVEQLFLLNIRGILNKLGVFDAAEYSRFTDKHPSPALSGPLAQKKTALYKEYFAYLAACLHSNEEILLKLDQLLLELSRLDSMDYSTVEDMPCMKELSALISQTKLYQQ